LSKQVNLTAETRTHQGKGASGRLRKQGRVPGIMYGFQVEPTAVSVNALELYHALHTDAGLNAMIRLDVDGDEHLTIARDLQYHPVRGEVLHVDFLAVDTKSQISVEVPIHLTGEDDLVDDNGVINQVLYTVPILVRPLDVPNYVELDITGMEIGDVRRVEDLRGVLPEGGEFDIDPERTVVTINAPISEAELEALEEGAGIEADEPETVGEEADEDSMLEEPAPAADDA
jgi:large subunit ribosomal protein L25